MTWKIDPEESMNISQQFQEEIEIRRGEITTEHEGRSIQAESWASRAKQKDVSGDKVLAKNQPFPLWSPFHLRSGNDQ